MNIPSDVRLIIAQIAHLMWFKEYKNKINYKLKCRIYGANTTNLHKILINIDSLSKIDLHFLKHIKKHGDFNFGFLIGVLCDIGFWLDIDQPDRDLSFSYDHDFFNI